jgi:hypothetical protein
MSLLDAYRKWRGEPTDAELEEYILLNLPTGSERTTLGFYMGIEKCWPRGVSFGRLYLKLDDLEREGLVGSRPGEPTPQRGNRRPLLWRIGGGKRSKPSRQRDWSGVMAAHLGNSR